MCGMGNYKSIIDLYILKSQGRMRLPYRCAEAVFEAQNGLHKWNIDYNVQAEIAAIVKEGNDLICHINFCFGESPSGRS